MKVITKNLRNSPLVGRSVGLPRWLSSKDAPANAGDARDADSPRVGKIPWSLENSTDRGAWQAAVHGVAKSQI